MRLSDREWKIFIIGDLFSIKRPIARNKDHYENGNVPFVASGSGNNGVMKCCKPHKMKNWIMLDVLQLVLLMEVHFISRIIFWDEVELVHEF